MAAGSDIAPFTLRDGRLHLEDVDLTDLAGALDGRAAWLISHAAVEAALAGASVIPGGAVASVSSGACCIVLGVVGPLAVLGQIAAAGWWAEVRSSHELTLALEAGFPPERLVAGGGVRDDGFVKDALAAEVAVMRHADDEDRANAARIAALLDHELPPEHGAPPAAPAGLLARCGGLLAPVLRAPPALAIDAVCPRLAGRQQVLALHAAERAAAGGMPASVAPIAGTLAGLPAGRQAGLDSGNDAGHGAGDCAGDDACAAPQSALVPRHVQRGDWVALPGAAADVRPVDPAHPAASTVLVRGESWRLLPARPLPPEMD